MTIIKQTIMKRNARQRASQTTSPVDQARRLHALAEAGAIGGALSPIEIREVCEALRARNRPAPTHFHSGFGA